MYLRNGREKKEKEEEKEEKIPVLDAKNAIFDKS